MSRWLKSVNNLLETLDGTAGDVADTVADTTIDGQIGQLLESGRQAVAALPKRRGRAGESSDDDDYDESYDDDEDYGDGEQEGDWSESSSYLEEEVLDSEDNLDENNNEENRIPIQTSHTATSVEEIIVTSEGGMETEDGLSENDQGVKYLEEALKGSDDEDESEPLRNDSNDDALSIEAHRRKMGSAAGSLVSDISLTEFDDLSEHHPTSSQHQQQEDSKKEAVTAAPLADHPPNPPSRCDSKPKQVVELAENASAIPPPPASEPPLLTEEDGKKNLPPSPKSSDHINLTTATNAKIMISTSNSNACKSPTVDQSPRQPRRYVSKQVTRKSIDKKGAAAIFTLPSAGSTLLEDKIARSTASLSPNTAVSRKSTSSHTLPPSLPKRQGSLVAGHNSNKAAEQTDVAPPSGTPLDQDDDDDDDENENAARNEADDNNNNNNNNKSNDKSNRKDKSVPASKYMKLLSKFQALQTENGKIQTELKMSQGEKNKLNKQLKTVNLQLETAQSEIEAQGQELRRAGERMEKDRLRAQEEREDLLDDHDDELEQIKEAHETEMDSLRNQYEQQIAELTQRLDLEEHRRMQEGGDATKELKDAMERERETLKQLNEYKATNTNLQSTVSKLETHQTSLQSKLDSALQAVKTATEREREAEDKLDKALSMQSRQLSQRQTREAELEKTIFELGAALTVARQQVTASAQQHASGGGAGASQKAAADKDEEDYKDKYLRVAEELEMMKVQFDMETQRREALQEELNDISKERAEEASSAHARQMQHDRKVSDLESTVRRLQTSLDQLKGNNNVGGGSPDDGKRAQQLSNELNDAQTELSRLSEQLLRHQRLGESAKSEILALKGRLKASQSRAEEAEKALMAAQSIPSTPSSLNHRMKYDVEAGGGGGVGTAPSHLRRRVKGGGRGRGGGRSMSAALHLGPGRNMEQVAETLDALDNWMVETGSFMRHEPFARLGFLLYLITLHAWTFCLVVFHETEVPHGDFGSMGNNPRHWRDHPASP